MIDMMTQEEAMNMSNKQAVQILIPMRNMMCDQNGCPISDAVFALDKAIEALSADRPRGEWIEQDDCWQCSNCGDEFVLEVDVKPIDAKMHYCPNCGCDMRGGSTNER